MHTYIHIYIVGKQCTDEVGIITIIYLVYLLLTNLKKPIQKCLIGIVILCHVLNWTWLQLVVIQSSRFRIIFLIDYFYIGIGLKL